MAAIEIDRLSKHVQRALAQANELAVERGHAIMSLRHLLFVLLQPEGVLAPHLEAMSVPVLQARSAVESPSLSDDESRLNPSDAPIASQAVREAISRAIDRTPDGNVGLESVALAALECCPASLKQALTPLGLSDRSLADHFAARSLLAKSLDSTTSAGLEAPGLLRFGRDLTREARDGRLMPVVGRKDEIRRVVETLLKKTKNNPVLIGDPGTGKTAIAEGIAQAIADGSTPKALRECSVVALDLVGLVAGTKYRGEFEERLKGVIEEVTRSQGRIILFLDELHTLVGSGGVEGGMDAANILKPALARGELRCVGATTFDEYRERIQKDGALERRFEPITVREPSDEEMFSILIGIRKRYEEFHCVTVSDEALHAIIRLTRRYLRNRFLPDKAIDVLDLACVKLRTNQESPELASSERTTVSPELIAEVVASRSGIPMQRMLEEDRQRLLNLEERVEQRVFGQKSAVGTLCRAVRVMRADVFPYRKPPSFLLIGPTGVGKTESAKALADSLFDDERALIRVDMGEYKDKGAVSTLLGARPGLVGFDQGGSLTEQIRRQPHSIVLFDEIEKADSEVLDVLLSTLDEGRLTDAKGRLCDFSNSILIFTSNLGVREAYLRTADPMKQRDIILETVKSSLRPEFVNRISDIVFFEPLSKAEIGRIVRERLARIAAHFQTEHGVDFGHGDGVEAFLAERAYDPLYGARPVDRVLQREVLSLLAASVLSSGGGLSALRLDLDGDGLRVSAVAAQIV